MLVAQQKREMVALENTFPLYIPSHPYLWIFCLRPLPSVILLPQSLSPLHNRYMYIRYFLEYFSEILQLPLKVAAAIVLCHQKFDMPLIAVPLVLAPILYMAPIQIYHESCFGNHHIPEDSCIDHLYTCTCTCSYLSMTCFAGFRKVTEQYM